MSRLFGFDDRLVLNDLNARSESEVIDGIYGMSANQCFDRLIDY